jgi:hypothetical protein
MPDAEIEGDPPSRPEDADGQATAIRGLALLVLAADCAPIVIAGGGAVAAVHAGWRGLAAGVLQSGVRAVREMASDGEGAHANGIVAVIGPCAGPCCYEVGPEVHEALSGSAAPKGPIDLREHARARLLAAGVAIVHDADACTICDRRFFSHRREGERSGRQAGVAWLS